MNIIIKQKTSKIFCDLFMRQTPDPNRKTVKKRIDKAVETTNSAGERKISKEPGMTEVSTPHQPVKLRSNAIGEPVRGTFIDDLDAVREDCEGVVHRHL